jgi:tripartite-type tricarboxylate transporter receptor subunit TctC
MGENVMSILSGLRRRLPSCMAAAALPILFAAAAGAQDYPTRAIRIVVPFPAGAGPDQVARMIAQHLRDTMGQPVVVENRTGALGSIGAQEVATPPTSRWSGASPTIPWRISRRSGA